MVRHLQVPDDFIAPPLHTAKKQISLPKDWSTQKAATHGFGCWNWAPRPAFWIPKFVVGAVVRWCRHLWLKLRRPITHFLIYSSSAILYRRRKLAVTLSSPKKVCLMPTVNLSCGLQLPLPWSRKLACCDVADLLNSAHIVTDVYVLSLQGIILVGRWPKFNRKG